MNGKLFQCLLLLGVLSFASFASMDDMKQMSQMSQMVGDSYWNEVASPPFKHNGNIRYYYIAADEVIHDYAPLGYNGITNEPFIGIQVDFTVRSAERIGSQYLKCLYREYTSDSFKTLKKRNPADEYLGFMGPHIRGEVGDIIKIVYKNNCRFPNNIYTRGVLDGNNNYAVQPGETYNYEWKVADRSGPGLHDGSSIHWKYNSNVDEMRNFYSGLIGSIIIVRKGWARSDGTPKDVDREAFWMFSVTNENNTPYIDENIERFIEKPFNLTALKSNGGFVNANFKFGINGFLYGNAPRLVMKKGDHVRWYVMSVGGVRDVHTPHWHGNTLLIDGMQMDVGSMLPGETIIADMVPDDVGIWLSHCHVGEHFDEGMITTYTVLENDSYKPHYEPSH